MTTASSIYEPEYLRTELIGLKDGARLLCKCGCIDRSSSLSSASRIESLPCYIA